MASGNWQSLRRWLAPAIGVLVVVIWALAARPSALTAPILTDDISQTRLNTVPPAPQGERFLEQTFTPRWDGLQEVELILARNGEPDPKENGRFTIQLFDDRGGLVGEQTLETRTLSHNQTFTLHFPAQHHSLNRTYRLRLSGSESNPVSVWAYTLDVIARGGLETDGTPEAGDLRFITRTRLTAADSFYSLGTMMFNDGLILLLAVLFLPLPGCLLLLLVGISEKESLKGKTGASFVSRVMFRVLPKLQFPLALLKSDSFAWWGSAFALGVSLWPLLWFGLTLINGRLRGWSLWAIFITGWTAVVLLWLGYRKIKEQDTNSPAAPLPRSHAFLLALLLLISVAVRLLAVRDLAFPAWVDSGRHALITAVMSETGQTPSNYAGLLPISRFPYHFGFHTLAASLELMTGWPLPRLLLFLGQLINGLVPLTMYTAVRLMTRRRGAGLLAAFLVGLPFLFPGFYVTWGRLTQLTAMFVMPVLVAVAWLVLRGSRRWRQAWWLLALLAAGVFYLHFRVFIYFLPLVPVIWLSGRGRHSRALAGAAGFTLLLTGPRLYQLWLTARPTQVITHTLRNYNAFPSGYVTAGWERYYLLAAAAFLLLLLTTVPFRGWFSKHWLALPLVMVGWAALLVNLLSLDRVGLPGTTIINLNSMYITLFLPLAVFLSVSIEWINRLIQRQVWLVGAVAGLILGGCTAALALFGIRQQISLLNPQTILARPADGPAINWVNENLPDTAVLAVSSWQWLGETWAGSDGGMWLVPLTRLRSTTPPADYTYNEALVESVRRFNQAAAAVPDWSDPAQAAWLRDQGVTHIFVGARGGFFDPAALDRNPEMERVFGRDGAFIFSIIDPP